MSRKIAIVVQRYGLEINGGAEYHARLIAERLGRHFLVEVFTTTACDYVTWAHHYPAAHEELNGKRFFQANYSWPVIESKYLEILSRLDEGRGILAQAGASTAAGIS